MEGIRVFVPDERLVWLPATVLSVSPNGRRFRVRLDTQSEPAPERDVDLDADNMPESLPLQNFIETLDNVVGAEDMCQLGHLHEPAIVYNVRARFLARQPYTYTGKIVVAVNPYQWLKKLYSETLRDQYTQQKWGELPPHVYATSAEAFHHMRQHQTPQSILVSGESGAGKTETVKILMEHLASISVGIAKRLHPQSSETIVVEKVLKSNPLLEAFGNAKTIRNDNSSRFGKFTQLQFDGDYCLVGAECRHYLLEKSRVVAQAPGERNYHIFYQLVSAKEDTFGFDDNTSAKEFRYLQDEHLLLDGKTDLERYQVTRDALTTIGLSDKEQNDLFSALCGILRLGQLDFVPLESNKDDASQAVASLTAASGAISATQIDEQKNEIEKCAKLLGVEVAALSKQMCSRTVKARQEVYCVPLSALHAGNNRDALAKEIYARVFGYLVSRVNYSISNSADRDSSTPSYLHIDLLDIFGFESFKHNSFEQFCINFANEKLQQKFTLDVFKTVQEEYQQEGVAWEFVTYRDNQDMLDLLENSMGVMALLNEECVRPMGSDLSFVSKLVSLRESHPRLERARLSQMHFMLHHYAGPVTYDAEGFVEKNKDSLQTDLLELLGTSSNELLSMVFGDDNTAFMTDADLAVRAATMMENGRRSTISRKTSTFMQETVSYKFKAQLSLLMSDISSTEVHYVRCIKPNSEKSPNTYEIDAVVNQLRCAGVVEAIRITRAAFPNKMAHEKFLRRFVFMRGKKDARSPSTTVTEACEQLAKELLSGEEFARSQEGGDHSRTPTFVVGKSLVYFGKDVLEFLEHQRTTFVHDRAIMIQHAARRWMARKRIKQVRFMISKLQAIQRCKMQRQAYLEKRRKCIIVQSAWRGVRSRQRVYLMMKEKSAIIVQAAYRRHLSEKKFAQFRNAVIKIQSSIKMKKQVGKYQRLLSERKEQDAMETEVELLKHRLEDEKRARMEIEAENSSLQQELNQVRNSSIPSASSSVYEHEAPPSYSRNSLRSSRIERESMDDGKLLDDSERMIDYLRKEVTKGRELIQLLSQENENLKAENKKIKDAYTAAGASFAALNQHNKQQSKANLRLMSTHAALIKSQEEKMKKYKKQVAELKEDLRMQRSVYSAELKARVHQQDVLLDIISLAESDGVSDDLLERMRAMAVDSKPAHENGQRSSQYKSPPLVGRRSSAASAKVLAEVLGETDHRENRSDTVGSMGPVPVSVSVNEHPTRVERRATLDTIMNNPVPRGVSPGAEGMSPPEGDRRESFNRNSLYGEDGHRKSRIGGMFKKMFKKEE